jgi:cellulose biosynthesis protein BcsQ
VRRARPRGIFTTLALTAAHQAIVPMKTEYGQQQATIDSLQLIEDVRNGLNPHLILWGMLPNQYRSHVLHDREVLQLIREDYGALVYEPSRQTTKYNDAMGAKADISELDASLGTYWDSVAVSVMQKGKECAGVLYSFWRGCARATHTLLTDIRSSVI